MPWINGKYELPDKVQAVIDSKLAPAPAAPPVGGTKVDDILGRASAPAGISALAANLKAALASVSGMAAQLTWIRRPLARGLFM